MRIAIHASERVFHAWPAPYWDEFIRKAKDLGHEIHTFADEPSPNERVEMAECQVFVGPKLRHYRLAKELGLKVVGLLGATLEGEGVKSPHPCAGCLDKLENQTDCFFGDEFCMSEITPNDVLAAL